MHAIKGLYFISVVAVLSSSPAVAALGPTNPPPGITPAAWRQATGRAAWVADAVHALVPEANRACIYAVTLEILGLAQVGVSQDVKGRNSDVPKMRRTVARGQEQALTDALKKNSTDECGGGSGGSGLARTVEGLLKFAQEQDEWETYNFERLKLDVLKAAEGMVKLGVFVAPGARALPLPAGVPFPVLNPELFMPRAADPSQGT